MIPEQLSPRIQRPVRNFLGCRGARGAVIWFPQVGDPAADGTNSARRNARSAYCVPTPQGTASRGSQRHWSRRLRLSHWPVYEMRKYPSPPLVHAGSLRRSGFCG